MKSLLMSLVFVIGSQAFAAAVLPGVYKAVDKETEESLVINLTIEAGNKFKVSVAAPIVAECTGGSYTMSGTNLTATPTGCNNAVLTGKTITLDVSQALDMAVGQKRPITATLPSIDPNPIEFILERTQ